MPVAYFSRQMKESEKAIKRDPMEMECLAIVESLKKFRPLIWGQRIVILSDNTALTWLFNKCTYKSPRLTRWALAVQGYNAEIMHLPGTQNRVADSLSRNPLPNKEEKSGEEILSKCDEIEVSLLGIYNVRSKPSQHTVQIRAHNLYVMEEERDESLTQAWTLDELKKEQWADANLQPIISYLKVPSEINRMKVNPDIKDLQDYFLDPADILFKQIVGTCDATLSANNGYEACPGYCARWPHRH